jgi:hypothetical protein
MDNYEKNNSNYYQNNDEQPKNKNYAKGMGIASMVLGIISIICCFTYVQIACALTGLILGIISKRKQNNGFAVAGIVTASFGLAIAVERHMTCKDLSKVVFPHPTVGEIFREAVMMQC